VPAPDRYVFHHQRTVFTWNGIPQLAGTGQKGYDELFTHDADLGEIAPMRLGRYVVSESATELSRVPMLIVLDLAGGRSEHPLPVTPVQNNYIERGVKYRRVPVESGCRSSRHGGARRCRDSVAFSIKFSSLFLGQSSSSWWIGMGRTEDRRG
jgi:hypothetical protein